MLIFTESCIIIPFDTKYNHIISFVTLHPYIGKTTVFSIFPREIITNVNTQTNHEGNYLLLILFCITTTYNLNTK
jgi:hypothetical protein